MKHPQSSIHTATAAVLAALIATGPVLAQAQAPLTAERLEQILASMKVADPELALVVKSARSVS
jgi:hypothetical protein